MVFKFLYEGLEYFDGNRTDLKTISALLSGISTLCRIRFSEQFKLCATLADITGTFFHIA